jgi:O-antigen/teichoic acid export membrane protein
MMQTILSQGAIVALNMMSGIVTARLLGAEGRGIFTAVTAWPQLLAYASFLGLPSAFVFFLRKAPAERRKILTAAMLLGTLCSTAAVLIGIIAVPFTMTTLSADTILLAKICILGTYIQFFNTMLRQALVGLGLFRTFNVSSLLAPGLYVLAMLLVWLGIGLTPATCAACLLLTILLTNIWMVWRCLSVVRPAAFGVGPWVRAISSYAGRAAASDLLSGLTSNLDRLALISFITPAELGRYAVAYSFSRLLQLPQVAVIMVLFPLMTGRPVAEVKRLHDLALRCILYALAVILLGALALGPWLLGVLYGREFRGMAVLCGVLFTEAAAGCIATLIAQLYMSIDRPGFTSATQVAGFVVLVVTLVLLVPGFGAMGAAAAMLAATAVRLGLLAAGIPAWLHLDTPRLLPAAADLAFLRQRFGDGRK